MKIGDNIEFGRFTWRVLEIQNDKILVITEKIIEKRPYHNTYEEVTWETCDLREYLNNEFYNSFSVEDKRRIIQTENTNIKNEWYGTDGGNKTLDYIFLLDTYDVVCKYFGDSSDKLFNKREKQRYWFEFRDKNNVKRLAQYGNNNFWWWLRSPGLDKKRAVYIHGNPIGCVGINGNNVFFKSYTKERNGGVRPALWLRI